MKYNLIPIGKVCRICRESINPIPGTVYSLYSLPAFDNQQKPEIIDGGEIKSSKLVVKENTILYNKLNVKFRRVWNIGEGLPLNSICSTEFIPLQCKDGVSKNYLYYNLISNDLTQAMHSMRRGTSSSQQRIDTDTLLNYEIPLPDFDTQVKIANILTRLDEKIELNNAINDNLAA